MFARRPPFLAPASTNAVYNVAEFLCNTVIDSCGADSLSDYHPLSPQDRRFYAPFRRLAAVSRTITLERVVEVSAEGSIEEYEKMLTAVADLLRLVGDPGGLPGDRTFVVRWEACPIPSDDGSMHYVPDMPACGRVSSSLVLASLQADTADDHHALAVSGSLILFHRPVYLLSTAELGPNTTSFSSLPAQALAQAQEDMSAARLVGQPGRCLPRVGEVRALVKPDARGKDGGQEFAEGLLFGMIYLICTRK